MDNKLIQSLCKHFGIVGDFQSYKQLTSGHINGTFLVNYYRHGEIKDYILQRINTFVFKKPEEMMKNVSTVTEYIRAKIKAEGKTAKRLVLHFQKCGDDYFYRDETGFWRCYRFIDDSVTFDTTENLEVIEQAGRGFGEFQMYLADFPVKDLSIAIPHFHNTVRRYYTFEAAILANKSDRAESVQDEITAYRAMKDIATEMYRMQIDGKLPLKVTHNDTKINNVLFDKDSFEHLAVLDLDTVMPGLVGFDFGDAIRFTANTAEEDEKDLSKVALDMGKYEAFTKGFTTMVGHTLSKAERDTLALGAISMTVECGLRFLTDYIDGDEYFTVNYPEHNIDRARCQLALAQDMITKYDEMKAIVAKYCR